MLCFGPNGFLPPWSVVHGPLPRVEQGPCLVEPLLGEADGLARVPGLGHVVVDVAVGHDPGDVSEELHPGVLDVLVPHPVVLEGRPHRVQEDGAHHAEVVRGDPGQPVVLAQPKQVLRALE